MRKRHRIKCQNQEYQRLKQDFCIFSGCKTINLPRIIFTLVQKAVMQAMLTTLPELNLFKADAKTAPKARQWHFALLKLLLQLQEFTFKDTAGRNATGLLRNPCTNLAIRVNGSAGRSRRRNPPLVYSRRRCAICCNSSLSDMVFFTDCQWVTLLCAAPGKISTLWIL